MSVGGQMPSHVQNGEIMPGHTAATHEIDGLAESERENGS